MKISTSSVALALTLLSASAAPAEQRDEQTVPRFVGNITPANAIRFLDAVADRTDRLVSLQVRVRPGSRETFRRSGYLSEVERGQYVLSSSRGLDGLEMVVLSSEVRREEGLYRLQGVYRVKGGGMHQGVVAFGLERVGKLEPGPKSGRSPVVRTF